MKRNLFINAVIILAALCMSSLTVSCGPEEQRHEDPRLELLSSKTMSVPASGCDTVIRYSLSDPGSGEISAMTEQQDWITGLDTASEGIVAFTVLPNDSQEQRTGEIYIAYPGADRIVVEIVQDCEGQTHEPVTNDDFCLAIVDITPQSVTVHVNPADTDMRYVTMARLKSQIDAMGDDETVFQNDLAYFQAYSQVSSLPLEEVIKLFGAVGEKDVQLYGLEAGQEYCFYVYGVSPDVERLTDICKMYFVTDEIEYVDVTFDIDITLDGFVADAVIKASDATVPFYFDLMDADTFRSGDPDEVVSDFIADIFAEYASYGFPAEYVIQRIGSFGEDAYSFGNLQPETGYVVFAAALDYDGMVVSEAGYEFFTTGKPGDASALTVSFQISDITSRGAYVEAYPSDKTVKYFWDVVPYGTPEDAVRQIIENTAESYIAQGMASDFSDFMANLLAFRGDRTYTYETLEGDTEYSLYSFGITEDGDYATGIMFGDVFRTLPQHQSQATIEVSYDKYFDSQEVAAEYPQFPGIPGMALVPSIVTTNDVAVGYYYTAAHGDMTDTMTYTDDIIIDQLMSIGMSEPMPYWLNYGEFTYLGVAYDEDGNFGPVFRAKHVLDEDGVSPVGEFDPDIMSASVQALPYASDLYEPAGPVKTYKTIDKQETNIGRIK